MFKKSFGPSQASAVPMEQKSLRKASVLTKYFGPNQACDKFLEIGAISMEQKVKKSSCLNFLDPSKLVTKF